MMAEGRAVSRVVASRRRQRSFVTGALILVVGSLGSRLLGATYRIILPILMGGGHRAAVGMGLYQMAYPLFLVAVTLISTGFPLAVSKLVSARLAEGDDAGAYEVFVAAQWALPPLGLVLALLLWSLAPWIATHIAHDVQAVWPVRAIAPALVTVSFAASYRGAFQGLQDMRPYAVSQIVEQVGRVLTMFALVVALLPFGLAAAAAGAAFGTVVGGGFSFAICRWFWPQVGLAPPAGWRRRSGPLLRALGRVLALAIPIAASASILPLLNLSDAVIVPLRLAAAGLGREAIALYGVLTGYASPLVLAPTVVTAALAMSLLPAVSSARASGDGRAGVAVAASGLRLAALFALPAAVGLAWLSGALPRLLFHAAVARLPLLALTPALVFLSIQQTSSGVLQALGRPDISVRNLAIGGAVKVVVAWWLVSLPQWNVAGAALSTSVAFFLACLLNLLAVSRRMPGAVDLDGMLLRPGLAAVMMSAALAVVRRLLEGSGPAVVVGALVAVGVVTYVAALLLLRGLRRADLELVPAVGPRAAATLARWGMVR